MATVIQQRTLQARPAGWSDSVTFDQVDPDSGVQSIVLSLSATLSGAVQVYSLERASARFTSTDTGTVSLLRPDGSVLLAATPTATVTALLPALPDVSASPAAVQSVLLPATASDTASNTYVGGGRMSPDAALLVGKGRVTLPVVTAARVSASAPGNFGAVFDSWVAATVSETATTSGTPPGDGGSVVTTVSVTAPTAILIGSVTAPAQRVVIGAATTGWSRPLGIAGFDSALGQLEQVTITIATTAVASLQAENLGSASAALKAVQTATVGIAAGSTVFDTQDASASSAVTLDAYDGQTDGAGPSGTVLGPRSVSAIGTMSLSTPEALGAFTGPGAANLVVNGAGQTAIDGPGALSIAGALQAGASIDVSYTYYPAAGAVFDISWYLAHNPDVAAAGIDGYTHFLQFGWHEGRDPGPAFDTADYLAANPDVAAASVDPLLHYVQFGRAEHRAAFAVPATRDPLVDAAAIYASYPAVAAAGQDASTWFHAVGWMQGANPDALFDTAWYLARNPDVAAAHVDPLLHFETYGWKEGRDPSAAFNTAKYLASNADVRAAGVDPLLHYLQYGQAEHRSIYPA